MFYGNVGTLKHNFQVDMFSPEIIDELLDAGFTTPVPDELGHGVISVKKNKTQ